MRKLNTIGALAIVALLLPTPAAAAPPDIPGPPYTRDGFYTHAVGTPVTYCAVTTDPDGDDVEYVFRWGDGTQSVSARVPSGTEGCAQHSWSYEGEFCVTVYAQDRNEPVPGQSACRTETASAFPVVTDHDAGCDPTAPAFGDEVTCWAWFEVNGLRVVDEERTGAVPDPFDGGDTPGERSLLHVEDLTVVPSQDLPPEDVGGTETPDHPGTEPVETPDHPGTDPVPTPGAGQHVATVTVRDNDALLCVDVTPEGGGTVEVACVGRSLLGPADALVPRGDTPVLLVGEDETPDVPGTDPREVPDAPGTPPQEVPDVPAVPAGSLGGTPHVTVTLDASYRYDPSRLDESARVLGQSVWSPVGVGNQGWYLANGDDVGLLVTVSVYGDGEHQATLPVAIPYLGQALAAAEKTAGTL